MTDWPKTREERRADFESQDHMMQLVRSAAAKGYHVIEIEWRKDWGRGFLKHDMAIVVRGRSWSLGKSRSFRFESRGQRFPWSKTDWEGNTVEQWIAELPVWQPWWVTLAHGFSRLLGLE